MVMARLLMCLMPLIQRSLRVERELYQPYFLVMCGVRPDSKRHGGRFM